MTSFTRQLRARCLSLFVLTSHMLFNICLWLMVNEFHRLALFHEMVQVLAKYVMMNIALFGDPAFKLFVPSGPVEKPASVVEKNGQLVASGPARWTKYKADQSLANEWNWPGSLYYFGAPGAAAQKHYAHGHDNEYPYLYARFTTTQDMASMATIYQSERMNDNYERMNIS